MLFVSKVSVSVSAPSATPINQYEPAGMVAGTTMEVVPELVAPPASAGTLRAPMSVSPASTLRLADR